MSSFEILHHYFLDLHVLAYEMVCSNISQGRVPQWEQRIQQGWNARLKYSLPVGMFKSCYGHSDTGEYKLQTCPPLYVIN